MYRALFACSIALAAAACSSNQAQFLRNATPTFYYWSVPQERIRIVDSPADIRTCERLGEVSPTLTTTPRFGRAVENMLQQTVALGGSHLYLEKRSEDWLLTGGIAYRCDTPIEERTVIRAKA